MQDQNTNQPWRSLADLCKSDTLDSRAIESATQGRFSEDFWEQFDEPSRRQVLKVMGASMALAGVGACSRRPAEHIVPHVRHDTRFIPGKPQYFATAVTRSGYAHGVLAECHMGRPTKLEGNPDHPASLGATDIFTQSEILRLYDPDRSQAVYHGGDISTWDQAEHALKKRIELAKQKNGAGLVILTGAVTSPTVRALIRRLQSTMKEARWLVHEPFGDREVQFSAKGAFGLYANSMFHVDKADVIISVNDDFLTTHPASVRYAGQFAQRRKTNNNPTAMTRLWVAETVPSITGAMADHRLPLQPIKADVLLYAIASELSLIDAGDMIGRLSDSERQWAKLVAQELGRHRGRGLLVADRFDSKTQMYANWINYKLGNVGATIDFIEPTTDLAHHDPEPARNLVLNFNRDPIESLLILDVNIIHNALLWRQLDEFFPQIPFTAHLGLYRDESALACQWHLPMAHELESWSDALAFDGTASIIQPLIEPLYEGRSPIQLLANLLGQSGQHPRDIVRAQWKSTHGGSDFETFWRASLKKGIIDGTAASKLNIDELRFDSPDLDRSVKQAHESRTLAEQQQAEREPDQIGACRLQFALYPDPTIWDGRYANLGWLQELPKPITKLAWSNALLISPATARKLNVTSGQVLKQHQGPEIGPVWVTPGVADDCVGISAGYGRSAAGAVGNGHGVNAFRIGDGKVDVLYLFGIQITATNEFQNLICTQKHHSMEGRHLVRHGTLDSFQRDPKKLIHAGHEPPTLSLYPEQPMTGHQWGMTIDLTTCIGCNACTIACQAENNIPVVGPEQTALGREMHWIRVDRYFKGPPENPEILHQPVPCMHCENAPCEVVCPVAATSHSHDGLNEMTYNRCVGTRYCSNNCPYKVRRFNFLKYTDDKSESLKLQRNPDVSVRMRGVMEKCTFCVQRIRTAEITARRELRDINDGEIITACQQVCPAQAITFGNINDPNSAVSRAKAQPHNFGLLDELNTRPRTTYLAKVTNPNPDLMTKESDVILEQSH